VNRIAAVGLAILLFLLVVLLYLPSLQNGFVWDDHANIVDNRELRTAEGLRRIWLEPGAVLQYYPLTYTTFWLEHRLWGTHPFGYHLVNILLHAGAAVLVWMALGRLGVPNAWLAAAIFAAHPLQVESVSWASERKTLLAAFFSLCSFLAYVRFAGFRSGAEREKEPEWVFYRLSMGFFICAVLSKTVACTLPVVFFLLAWWRTPKVTVREVEPLIPMVLISFVMGLTTMWVEERMGSQGAAWAFSIFDRVLIAGQSVWFYVWKLVWPFPSIFIYPRWPLDSAWRLVFPLAAIAITGFLWVRRDRLGKTPLFATLYFVVSLSPTLGFLNFFFMKYSFVADRFQYLAGVGLIGAAAAVSGRRWRFALVMVLAGLAPATWQYQKAFQTEETIWRDTIRKNPGAWMAYNNLGNELARRGNLQDAAGYFTESVRINPDHISARINLGNALWLMGRAGEALDVLSETARIWPDHADAHFVLGTALAQSGRAADAMSHFREAVRLNPDHADAHHNLGVALAREGKSREAAIHFAEALRVRPDFEKAHEHLNRILAELERPADGRTP